MNNSAWSVAAPAREDTKRSEVVEYHVRQFEHEYRSTEHLRRFAERFLDVSQGGEAVDVCCGAGANMYHLGRAFPNLQWTGVDINEELLETGKGIFERKGASAEFVHGDARCLAELFGDKQFDVVFSIQSLSWMPHYEGFLEPLLAITKPHGGTMFITSLFTDSPVDAQILLTEYGPDRSDPPYGPFNYNVYSTDRFIDFCYESGAARVDVADFEIDIDLQPPERPGLGTFTRTLADGSRLQFSGPLWLPWKFLAVHC